jgi:hypothetical protein
MSFSQALLRFSQRVLDERLQVFDSRPKINFAAEGRKSAENQALGVESLLI